jgi:hypothetical protein
LLEITQELVNKCFGSHALKVATDFAATNVWP